MESTQSPYSHDINHQSIVWEMKIKPAKSRYINLSIMRNSETEKKRKIPRS